MRDALTKARECVSAFEAQFGLITPSERDALHESIAALLTQVRNEALASAEQDNKRLLREIEGERDARQKLDRALREKDRAMGELFHRLQNAGVDCSDLIP